jgi:OOP family OmpA-OmpF porin
MRRLAAALLAATLLVTACASAPELPPPAPAPVGEPDTDRTGELEAADGCVGEPETRNGLADGDGCPDEIPPELSAALAPVRWTPRELGELARGRVGRNLQKALQRVAEAMRAHPDIVVEIRFHHDEVADPKTPQPCTGGACMPALTQFLIEREGIGGERLQTSFAGADEPLDSNKTPAGRARNRRFEFNMLAR